MRGKKKEKRKRKRAYCEMMSDGCRRILDLIVPFLKIDVFETVKDA